MHANNGLHSTNPYLITKVLENVIRTCRRHHLIYNRWESILLGFSRQRVTYVRYDKTVQYSLGNLLNLLVY